MTREERINEIVDARLEAGNFRHDIADLVPEGSSRIMEYGFGDGSLLLGLERDKGCRRMFGIEVNPKLIARVDGLLEETWQIDLNDENGWLDPEYEGFFNYILAPMSLEHTYDPWYVLKKFNKYLANGGKVIAQVPNAQCWECLYHLMTGDFPYVSGGTWDFTHIRWYTLKSLMDIAFVAGFKIKTYIANYQQNVDLSHLEAMDELTTLTLPPEEFQTDLKRIEITLPYDIKPMYHLLMSHNIVVTMEKDREPEDFNPTKAGGYLESYRLNSPNPFEAITSLMPHPIIPSSIKRVRTRAVELSRVLRDKATSGKE